MTERSEQAALFEWAEWMGKTHADLNMMFAIPNGQVRPGVAVEPGLQPGVPDIFLAVPKNDYHGMFIELKWGKNKVSAWQAVWLTGLRRRGYWCAVCYGADEAIKEICKYLEIENK